jgi:hypothetical protein
MHTVESSGSRVVSGLVREDKQVDWHGRKEG